ncbi:uncharacterized protein LOC129912743 [Episyrphus balteatus]|uniref:uncharacterized protein LOC129912743 n=1 Tax=Episyrphus balteatus TaxID=286459 RepID=UPI00248554DC|nr:uncharacterized protein LOC129912743 [Episyrphus balteatus]XP_055847110.1 uncharacterized protein LOC129912743 [Episyrphus balteatus]XP_055847111.1 uncharacterized protein LOC129912743 [Episyrphus balteatus]
MDMSLDEIIKTKKITPPFVKKVPFKSAPYTSGKVFTKDFRIKDARLKIIERNRSKIRDARDKLAEITRTGGDARLRLVRKQGIISSSQRNRKAPVPRVLSNRNAKFGLNERERIPEVLGVPRGYVDYDNMERLEEEEYAASINRAVKNELAYDNYRAERHAKDPWDTNGGDPFELYNIPISRAPPEITPDDAIRRQYRQMSPSRTIRQLSPPFSRRYVPQPASHLSYEMRSRLEHAPDRNVSMGIFSNPLKPQNSSQLSGYRIVVSNLNTSVTQGDIKELFEDLGELYESRLVRPGIAEVIYKDLKDAEKAVETYHNRQLDGQPMKCLLVNPRSSSKPTAPAIKIMNSNTTNRVPPGKIPLEIDIDALHKVLFRRH